jgi:hypothetical protein
MMRVGGRDIMRWKFRKLSLETEKGKTSKQHDAPTHAGSTSNPFPFVRD